MCSVDLATGAVPVVATCKFAHQGPSSRLVEADDFVDASAGFGRGPGLGALNGCQYLVGLRQVVLQASLLAIVR